MNKYREFGKYLVVDPQVCFGKLTFKGTRLTVATVLTLMSQGRTMEEILQDWPYLSRQAVGEALHLAGKALVQVCGAAPTDGDLETQAPWERNQKKTKTFRAKAVR